MTAAVFSDLGSATATGAAVVLAVALAWAAVAKLMSADKTTEDFASLGLVRPDLLARLTPLVELAVGALLLVARPLGGMAATALLVMFTTVIVRVLRDPQRFGNPSCACFGGTSHQPLTWRSVGRNAALTLLAVVATLG